jgi:hypothetical protein
VARPASEGSARYLRAGLGQHVFDAHRRADADVPPKWLSGRLVTRTLGGNIDWLLEGQQIFHT